MRKLCTVRGLFPREPKVEGNHKTYYHMKDIAFLLHDPFSEKFHKTCFQMKDIAFLLHDPLIEKFRLPY